MDYLPLFHRLQGQSCLLVGGGAIARRKAELLLKAGARLDVIAPRIDPLLQQLITDHHGQVFSRSYAPEFLDQRRLVVVATDDSALNRTVAEDCHSRGIAVNVVDQLELCSVIMPAIVDRSPLLIALSTAGKAPVLARTLRARLETLIPASYGRLAALAGRYREQVKQHFGEPGQRRRFWERVLQGSVAEQLLSANDQQAEQILAQQLQQSPDQPLRGEVYLVGAGPGDPDLLTFKALRLMQQADVVLHDRLVSEEVLALVRRDAEFIYVGKARADHALPQQEINQRLVSLALEGKRVLRLKGGDPFIFGRGGEEIASLTAQQIPFQVVPGITAASGCACYAGIPLTHRDHAQSVRFLTGHMKDQQLQLPWKELLSERETLVIYMGLHSLERLCSEMIAHGRSPDTPLALVSKGTLPDQRVWVSTLGAINQLADIEQAVSPSLIIVGGVVTLHHSLGWYQNGQ